MCFVCFSAMAFGNFVMSDVASAIEMVYIVKHYVPFGRAWCYSVAFLSAFSYTQSMLFITLIAVIRAISGLSKYHNKFSTKTVIIYIAIVYALSIVCGITWSIPGIGDVDHCLGYDTSESVSNIFVSYIILVITLFIITFCSYLTLILWMHCKNSMAGNRKSEILTLKASVAVTVLFVACYVTPLLAGFVSMDVPLHQMTHVMNVFNVLAYVQSAVNPYIYLATNSHFREIYKTTCYKVLSCCIQRPRAVSDSNSGNNNTSSNTMLTGQEP